MLIWFMIVGMVGAVLFSLSSLCHQFVQTNEANEEKKTLCILTFVLSLLLYAIGIMIMVIWFIILSWWAILNTMSYSSLLMYFIV